MLFVNLRIGRKPKDGDPRASFPLLEGQDGEVDVLPDLPGVSPTPACEGELPLAAAPPVAALARAVVRRSVARRAAVDENDAVCAQRAPVLRRIQ